MKTPQEKPIDNGDETQTKVKAGIKIEGVEALIHYIKETCKDA